MNLPVFFYSLLLLFALPAAAQAQNALWFHKLNKEGGILNTIKIYEVYQDSEGFTWIGAESGLYRFDGRSVVSYEPDPEDTTALCGNLVLGRFFEDSRKNIWFCHDGAIQCYQRNDDNFKSFSISKQGIPFKSGYKAIHLERDSLLWVKVGNRRIYTFNIYTHAQSGQIANTVFDIDVFPGVKLNGRLRYLFSVDGSKSPGIQVFEFDEGEKPIRSFIQFRGDTPDFPSLNIHQVFLENDTTVWFSSDSGIYRWNVLSPDRYKAFPVKGSQPKLLVPFDSTRFIVTELNEGLFILNENGEMNKMNCRLASGPLFDVNRIIADPFVSPAGNIWIVTAGEGLVFSDPEKVKFGAIPKIPVSGGSTNYIIRTMVQDANHQIWCSTFDNGILLLDEKGNLIRHYHPANPPHHSLNSRQVIHLLMDKTQRLWAATAKGVSCFDRASGTFIPIAGENGEQVDYVAYLYQLKNGDILASTLQHGIFKIVPWENSWRLRQILAPGHENDMFTTIYEDQLGSIYISHAKSEIVIFNYVEGKLQELATKEIKGPINGFYEDPDQKTLWIASPTGLAKLDKANLDAPLTLFTTRDGLPGNEIQSLAPGRDSTLWMGTSHGLVRFDPDSSKFVNFTLADGAQSRYFNPLAVLAHEDGTLWFGGDNGITIVDPTDIQFLEVEPKIQVTEILVNDKPAPGLADAVTESTNVTTFGSIVRDYDENTLSFSFVAIDYSDPASTQLHYMLKKYEEEWVVLEKGEPGFARYPKLPPGEYTLMIRAKNSDGVLSGEVKELKITINPPWYQTWWARLLFILLILAILYALYRYRVYQIRKEEAFKRREAEYKQLVAETETAVLRLQMNPHFIFNSMNSISSYILQKDIETANDYLNRFARLMRMILKLAERPFLAVSQELELLELYLDTEAMRFEDTIDYEFIVAEGLDPDEAIIPTMILQPFIENAIWHGLAKKKGKKKITISFALEQGQLVCSVQDNGIGRTAAAQGKAARPSHESKAISITEKRLRLLEEMEGAATSLQVIDLQDEEGLPAGTRVAIRLPLL